MKYNIICSLTIISFLCTPTKADVIQHTIFMGAGTMSCSSFAEAYRNGQENSELVFFTWAQGYMSGFNSSQSVLVGSYHYLNSVSTESQRAFIRYYCDDHPLANYVEAVTALMGTMGGGKIKENPPVHNGDQ